MGVRLPNSRVMRRGGIKQRRRAFELLRDCDFPTRHIQSGLDFREDAFVKIQSSRYHGVQAELLPRAQPGGLPERLSQIWVIQQPVDGSSESLGISRRDREAGLLI